MAVLVTGGAGFLGSHLVDRLVRDGEHVIVFDDLSSGKLPNLEKAIASGRATFVYIDVSSPLDALRTAVRGATHEPLTRIFHLASPASPEAYGARPWETMQVNGLGTMNLIDLAIEEGAKLLYTSTSEAYGDPLEHPQRETYFGNVNPVGPRACYDEGKRFGEAAMSVAIASRGLDGRVVRIFNCYGPRMDIGDGRLIPSLFGAAEGGRPLPIHGTGTQTRSMTYVDDLVEGLLTVERTAFPQLQVVNLGSEEENSVFEIAQAVATVVGIPLRTVSLPPRPEDPKRRRPQIEVAQSLGWSPKTTLAQGLQLTYAWLKNEALQYV